MNLFRKAFYTICVVAGFIAISVGAFVIADRHAEKLAASGIQTASLVDTKGKAWRVADLKDKIGVFYFGYTYCPDVCPTALNVLSLTLDELAAESGAYQAIFVSVDPKRDTPDSIDEYLSHLDSRILGLTGTPDQLKAFTQVFGATFRIRNAADGEADYLIDHTANFFVANGAGVYEPLPLTHGAQKLHDILLNSKRRLGVTP
jgi:cytochrome oxidase Cu insertion factor (SCO1/SenC/PrrC family)